MIIIKRILCIGEHVSLLAHHSVGPRILQLWGNKMIFLGLIALLGFLPIISGIFYESTHVTQSTFLDFSKPCKCKGNLWSFS